MQTRRAALQNGRIGHLARAAQMLAVIAFVVLAVLSGRPHFSNASEPVRGVADPAIALQMARDLADIDAILSDAPSPDREVMRIKQGIDFAFIATYVAIGLVMSWALRRRMPLAAAGLAFCTMAAGFFDVSENLAILRLLPVGLAGTTPAMIQAIHGPSMLKWSLASLAMVFVSLFFFESRRWYLTALGGFDLASAALICWGLAHNAALPWGAALFSLGLVASAATLKWLPHEPSA
jgi:hypothetical protein